MTRQLTWDDTFCPEGHGKWVFVPASTLYSDIYWCPSCDCFYQPIVKRVDYEELNKEFSNDRAADIREFAKFIAWKAKLSPRDMPRENKVAR